MENLAVVNVVAGTAEIGFEQAEAYLVGTLKKYQGYVLTNISEAKKDRAELNKISKSIDDEKKKLKKAIMKPYDDIYEPKFKSLLSLVSECTNVIDEGIKDEEGRAREEKRKTIEELWSRFKIADVDLSIIYNPRWENATTSLATVEKEMQDKINQIREDCITAESIGGIDCRLEYIFCLDLNKAIAHWKAKQDLLKIDEVKHEESEEKPIEKVVIKKVTLEVRNTEQNLKKLGDWLRANGFVFTQLTNVENV